MVSPAVSGQPPSTERNAEDRRGYESALGELRELPGAALRAGTAIQRAPRHGRVSAIARIDIVYFYFSVMIVYVRAVCIVGLCIEVSHRN